MERANIFHKFSGAVNLGNDLGTVYVDRTTNGQFILTGATALVAASAKPNGSAIVSIDCNGFALTVPGSWVKYGGDDIDTTAGKVNHITVYCKQPSEIFYSNKVV